MRVVHVPFGYYPDAVGGTEAYVAELARGLRVRGVDSVVAAPAASLGAHRYDHDGTPVYRFAMSPTDDVGELYGEGDPDAASAVSRILDDVRADVLHLHAFTRAASLRLARTARRQGLPVVFTYHTPTGTEGLFDRAADPKLVRNLAAERPADLERLRNEMLEKLDVETLEELRHPQQELIDRLHGLGYF